MAVALRRNETPQKVIDRIGDIASRQRKSRGFTTDERDLVKLIYRMGSGNLVDIVAKGLGLEAARTSRDDFVRDRPIPRPSPTFDIIDDVKNNLMSYGIPVPDDATVSFSRPVNRSILVHSMMD